ncbi:MAG: PqqD family protein [Firmicutes bacterium]|nr:PqqD family protein [Bacillota bacterium]
MKINSGFISHQDGEEQLLVSTGTTVFSGLVRSNPTAGFIINCLMEETTLEEIVEKMRAKWDVSPEVAMSDVEKVVNGLRSIGAIDD